MAQPHSQSERLARIEAQLERLLSDVASIKQAQDVDIARLAAWESKGRGMLIGVGIAGSAIGAIVSAKLGTILMAITGVFK